VRFPRSYLDLARPGDPDDPVRRIGWPDAEEIRDDPEAIADPVGEDRLRLHPLLLRKYPDRALLLVTARCHFYCRFCFRAGAQREPGPGEVEEAIAVLGAAPSAAGVREVILSGGDPLVLADARLAEILQALAALPRLERIRIHTRAPVHDPDRVTPALVRTLREASPRPLRVAVHTSHPRELTPAFDRAVALLRGAGIPLLNQTVLLRGVNADARVLAELFAGLAARGVHPYYLHHPDRVAGAARFRVTIEQGLAIDGELRGLLPREELPAYVLDLPDGSGKVPVASLERAGPRLWRWRGDGGGESLYEDIERGSAWRDPNTSSTR